MKKIVLHPEIFLVENFLSRQECNSFIEKGEQVSFEEAKVNIHGRQTILKGVRNNDRILFKDNLLSKSIWSKIAPFVPEKFGKYRAIGVNELFRIYRYAPGQRFKMHRDGSYERNEKECSFFSFLMYLNEGYEGGETYFEEGITIIPKLGNALLFHHPLRHEGKTLISGVKYVLRTDVMYEIA
ncbi:2OG-Fe(II) oxygenase [Spongiimicrobium salis]|uniref:2OG-Fe(II) oxygenase n=1 Tax=Spongiimicrobium salis TaxID=1667022 RepID=UPI00374CCF44